MTKPGQPQPELDRLATQRWPEVIEAIDALVDRANQDKQWTTRPGTPLAGDDRNTRPYQLSHAVQMLLVAGIDNLNGVRHVTFGRPGHDYGGVVVLHQATHYVLARSAIENFATALWLLGPRQRPDRIARLLRWHAQNIIDNHNAVDRIAPAVHTRETRLAELEKLAVSTLGAVPARFKGYSTSEIVKYADEFRAQQGSLTTHLIWQVCSGFAHARPWTQLNFLEHDLEDTEIPTSCTAGSPAAWGEPSWRRGTRWSSPPPCSDGMTPSTRPPSVPDVPTQPARGSGVVPSDVSVRPAIAEQVVDDLMARSQNPRCHAEGPHGLLSGVAELVAELSPRINLLGRHCVNETRVAGDLDEVDQATAVPAQLDIEAGFDCLQRQHRAHGQQLVGEEAQYEQIPARLEQAGDAVRGRFRHGPVIGCPAQRLRRQRQRSSASIEPADEVPHPLIRLETVRQLDHDDIPSSARSLKFPSRHRSATDISSIAPARAGLSTTPARQHVGARTGEPVDEVAPGNDDGQVSQVRAFTGCYDASRAAALSGVPKSTVYWWAREGIVVPSVSPVQEKLWSFGDLIALRIVTWLRHKKGEDSTSLTISRTPMPLVREAIRTLENLGLSLWDAQQAESPLLVDTNGKVYLRAHGRVTDLSGAEVLPQFETFGLTEPFTLSEGWSGPNLVQPREKLRIVPGKVSGEPHVARTRITTLALASLANDGFSISRIAEMYELADTVVEQALDLERQLGTLRSQPAA